jgi:hypothetical protein
MMAERDRFTPEEWRTLQLAPFWMFSAVVGAYNRFDPRDFQVFTRCLEAAALAGDSLQRELLASVVADHDRLAEQFRAEPRTIGVGLFQVDLVLAKADGEEAAGFKACWKSWIMSLRNGRWLKILLSPKSPVKFFAPTCGALSGMSATASEAAMRSVWIKSCTRPITRMARRPGPSRSGAGLIRCRTWYRWMSEKRS